ncbi:MAG: hypothetical protein HDR38_03625 [Treponema sp.]|nr:hypothetical protein [Treponema sp.]
MMKKISKLALLAAATAFLLAAFPACSNDDGDGNETELDGDKDTTGDDDEKGDTPATANAVWDWSTATEVPGGIGTTKLTADSDNIPPSSGSGATIKALKGSQFAAPTSGQGLKANGSLKSEPTSVDHTKAGSSGLCKSWLEFTLSAGATVKIEGAATNTTDYRCIILADSNDTIIEMLHSTTTSTGNTCPLSTTQKLNAGTYYIGLDGAYISKITCE